MLNKYCKREWLNSDLNPSTGSVVAYHGDAFWNKDDEQDIMTFLELADCHDKIRLHKTDYDKMEDFIKKMEKLRNVIDDFIIHLNNIVT